MSNTPETDKSERMAYSQEYMVPTEFARKLERERDEAKEERDKIQTELEMWRDGNILHEIHRNELKKVERERDEAREKVDQQRKEIVRLNGATSHAGGTPLKIALRERDEALSQIVQAECRAERFCQERDDAREALMKIEDLFLDGTDTWADRENMGLIARNALEEIK